MGDLSKHFSRWEFRSGDGDERYATVDSQLLDIIQAVRDYYRRTVTITSGHRSPSHNRKVGGATKSWHLVGRAADIRVRGIRPQKVAEYIRRDHMPDFGGVGIYDDFVHLDTRPTRVDWQDGE